jgi:hypothetical protein
MITAQEQYGQLWQLSNELGRRLLDAVVDLVKELDQAEIDPAHFVVALLRAPGHYAATKTLYIDYGLDLDTAFGIVSMSFPPKGANDERLIINEATVVMIRAVYSYAGEQRRSGSFQVNDIAAAVLQSDSRVVQILISDGDLSYEGISGPLGCTDPDVTE